jgi:hypothetical protein
MDIDMVGFPAILRCEEVPALRDSQRRLFGSLFRML